MADPFGEHHWIAPLAEKEKQRRNRIIAFTKALPKFQEILLAALAADINEYQREFHGEQISMMQDQTVIHITNSTYDQGVSCHIGVDPNKQRLTYQFSGTTSGSHNSIALEMSELGIHKNGATPELTAREISKAVLRHVLFPEL